MADNSVRLRSIVLQVCQDAHHLGRTIPGVAAVYLRFTFALEKPDAMERLPTLLRQCTA
jgi:hypothetical protein